MKVKIGLEVHCQLNTKSKLFCSCKNEESPIANSNVCPICLGFPGSKPVVNREAIKKAIAISLALNCKINERFAFSRKVYFYPDMSKNYQISQYELPIAKDGYLFLEKAKKKIGIRRIQVEEDPAKIVHVGNIKDEPYVLIDYNRSGIPLIEIVTEPSFNNIEEVKEFFRKLLSYLKYYNIFDPKKGKIRADVNISIDNNERVEIKNVSGVKNIEKAITFEIIRQKRLIAIGKKIERETRCFDENLQITYKLREKEVEEEYGYIFDTDLPIFESKIFIEEVKREMKKRPEEVIEEICNNYKISKELARAIVFGNLQDIFYYLCKNFDDAKLVARLLGNYLLKCLNYFSITVEESKVKKEELLRLLNAVKEGKITERYLKEIMKVYPIEGNIDKFLTEMLSKDKIEEIAKEVIEEEKRAVKDYLSGKKKAIQYLIGKVLKKINYRGNVKAIKEVLIKLIKKL